MIPFELTGDRMLRGHVFGTVRAVGPDGLLYADSVNLSTRKGREGFGTDLTDCLNGTRPAGLDVEAELLRLLAVAGERLAAEERPSAPAEAEGEERIEDYVRRLGRFEFVRIKEAHGHPVEVRVTLSNFTAEIVEDVTVDDGLDARRYFVVRGVLDHRPLRPARVPAGEFAGLNWVVREWGAAPRVMPGTGRRDQLRDAIQAFSGGVPQRTVYGHTGWREHGGVWVYLTAEGAIGPDGPVPGAEVELDGKLRRYALPAPPQRLADLVAPVRASWDLWGVAPAEVSAPALGVVYGALLAEWLKPDFALWLRGITGQLKTSYSALLLNHCGDFDWKNTPANWESTANALEKASFAAKDVPFLIDDYRPPADRSEASEMRRKATRLLRAAGNRAGRARMTSELALRPEYYPRGVVWVTAEERAPGESTAARLWEVEIGQGMLRLEALSKAYERAPLYRTATAGYVQWIATKMADGAAWLHEAHQEARRRVAGVRGHLRHPMTAAYLLASWSVFAEYAQAVGAVDADEARRRLTDVETALVAVAEKQAEVARGSRPEIVFLETLGDLLAGGRAHLSGKDHDAEPKGAEKRWGWREVTVGSGDFERTEWRPSGDKVGWLDEDSIYLIPLAAHRLVARALADRGDSFIVSDRMLHEALERGGFLAASNKGRRHNVSVDGAVRNTVRLALAKVLGLWGADD